MQGPIMLTMIPEAIRIPELPKPPLGSEPLEWWGLPGITPMS